jgi:pimeloyl-ACP methyl ester carboxylesterase
MPEQTVVMGANNHLVATLTSVDRVKAGAPNCVAVLTNSGVIPRSGPHRMNVHLARKFAEMGIPSIRFDMSGLGDSGRASGALPAVQQWVADTRAAMDVAQKRFGCDRFFMVGFCSGAEVAHLVALEDTRMRAVLLWDLYAYPTFQSRLRTVLYKLRRAGARRAVQKLTAKLVRTVSAVSPSQDQPNQPTTEVSLVPARDAFAKRIQTLVDGGVELMFAYSGGEPVWFNHSGQFRGMFGGYGFVDKVAFNYLEISDHLITRRPAQEAFIAMVVQWLQQRVESTRP